MGALTTQSVTFDVQDAAIAPITADLSGGTDPVYTAWQDVPGIQQVQVNPSFITAELKGDGKVIDNRAKTSSMDITANYAIQDLTILKAILGGTLTATATTKQEWVLLGTNSIPFVRFGFVIRDVSVGIGSIVVCLNKAKVTGGNLFDQQTDQYGARSLQLQAIAPLSNDKLIQVSYNSTVVALSVAYPSPVS